MESMNDQNKSLLIKNLSPEISAKEFYKMFETFGEVKSSKLEVDDNGVSKCYGYVYYADEKSAEAAKFKLVINLLFYYNRTVQI
jgi:RNA recognition motif-containing protein